MSLLYCGHKLISSSCKEIFLTNRPLLWLEFYVYLRSKLRAFSQSSLNIVLEFDDEIWLRTKTMPSSAFNEGWNLIFPDCQTVHVGIETENR